VLPLMVPWMVPPVLQVYVPLTLLPVCCRMRLPGTPTVRFQVPVQVVEEPPGQPAEIVFARAFAGITLLPATCHVEAPVTPPATVIVTCQPPGTGLTELPALVFVLRRPQARA